MAHSANVVDVLAAFGLGYTIVKVLVGVLGEVRHAGLVLVHDRNGKQSCYIQKSGQFQCMRCSFLTAYRRMLLFTIIAGSLLSVVLIITGEFLLKCTL